MKTKQRMLFAGVIFAIMLVFIGCTSSDQLSAPKDLRVEDNKIFWASDENVNTRFTILFSDESGKETRNIVTNGQDLNEFDLHVGTYKIKIKEVCTDGTKSDSEYSEEIEYIQEARVLSTPTNVKIENNIISWENVTNANNYKVLFTDSNGKETIKDLPNGSSLLSLSLPSDNYSIKVKAISANPLISDSEYSAVVSYSLELIALDAPTNCNIDNDLIYFDEVIHGNSYQVVFTKDDGNVYEGTVENQQSINEFLLPVGIYTVKVKAIGDNVVYKDSPYSTEFTYTKELTYMTLTKRELINSGYVKWMGRTYYNEQAEANEIYHSASGFEVFFKGNTVKAVITATKYNDEAHRPYIVIVVDDDFTNAKTVILTQAETVVDLIINNQDSLEHKIDLYKRSESIDSHIAIKEIKTDGYFIKKIVNKELKIEVIAASSSTGYGNLSNTTKTTANSDCLKAFAFLTAQALNADLNIYSASGWGCKASLWTSPNSLNVYEAYKNVDFMSSTIWAYEKYIPDIVVINLGTNDWSYINSADTQFEKDARMTAFQKQYVDFLKYLHQIYPNAEIVVLYGLMNESNIYTATESIITTAKTSIPNLKSIKINGDAKGYNSHPSVESHADIAKKLTEYIRTFLKNN